MTEDQAVEAELVNDTASDFSDAVTAVVDETVRLVDALGKAIVCALEDASNLMVIKVEPDTREHLDLLVNSGVAKNRRAAATSLIGEAIAMQTGTFERIRQTQAQISELRQQMRSLVKSQV